MNEYHLYDWCERLISYQSGKIQVPLRSFTPNHSDFGDLKEITNPGPYICVRRRKYSLDYARNQHRCRYPPKQNDSFFGIERLTQFTENILH